MAAILPSDFLRGGAATADGAADGAVVDGTDVAAGAVLPPLPVPPLLSPIPPPLLMMPLTTPLLLLVPLL